jgi:hypothetical protein
MLSVEEKPLVLKALRTYKPQESKDTGHWGSDIFDTSDPRHFVNQVNENPHAQELVSEYG